MEAGDRRLLDRLASPGCIADKVDLAAGKNFAVLTTLMADGSAQTHVMWVDTDGEHLLMNTERHRQKFRNIEHDPRVTVTLIDRRNRTSSSSSRVR